MGGFTAATAVHRRRREIAACFDRARAYNAESARPAEELRVDASDPQFLRLLEYGAVNRTGDGRYFLDPVRWQVFRNHQRGRALSYMGIAVFLVLLVAILASVLGGR